MYEKWDFCPICKTCVIPRGDEKMVKFWKPELSNINTKDIGDGSIIHSHVWIGTDVKIGSNVRVQAFSFIPDGITIEDDVFIGPRVTFTNDKYPPSDKKHWAKTTVRSGATICAGVIVVAGVTIGEGAFVGAGSIVTKDIPAGETWYGTPAKKR